MSLVTMLKERDEKRKKLRQDVIKEVSRLVSVLKKRYSFDSVYIYGSLLTDKFSFHSDIDLVIKGLKKEDFFKAYALLLKESVYRIDLKPFEDMPVEMQEKVLLKGKEVG